MGKKCLFVGLNCLDIISFINKYPEEDSDQRCNNQSWERGGNASNNATVLRSLGAPEVEYFGTLVEDNLLKFFQDDMDSYGIKHGNCPILKGYKSPASVVICSEETGSRTIVHHNGGLPELTFDQFKDKVSLDEYSWVHFEGRNVVELEKILKYIQEFNLAKSGNQNLKEYGYQRKALPVSIEIEKRRDLSMLIPYGDVIFFGKDYSMFRGAKNSTEAAQLFSTEASKGTLVVCSWGEDGASYTFAGSEDGIIKRIEAYPPGKIVDSLGAGDAFNSAVIFALLVLKWDPEKAIKFGCRVASAKLEIFGFRGLKLATRDILSEFGES